MSGESPDPGASLLDELRREAAERRARRGPSQVPPPEAGVMALRIAGPAKESERWAELERLGDLSGVVLASHRRLAGRIVLSVKRGLQRLLTAELGRQSRFHQEAVRAVAGWRRRSHAALDALEGRLDAAEEGGLRVAGRLGPAAVPFDYGAFEEAFRGPSESLRRSLETTLALLGGTGAAPVLDLGCGRGDLLALLRARRVEARGIDGDAGAVESARGRGLAVSQADLLEGLRACSDASLGAVVAVQVIEQPPQRQVLDLLRLARVKLRPGGVLLLETVHVASGYALAHGWSIDPTHRQRLHPEALRALATDAGFERVELRWSGPVPMEDRLEAGPAAIRVDWLFAPQDVTLVGRAPALV